MPTCPGMRARASGRGASRGARRAVLLRSDVPADARSPALTLPARPSRPRTPLTSPATASARPVPADAVVHHDRPDRRRDRRHAFAGTLILARATWPSPATPWCPPGKRNVENPRDRTAPSAGRSTESSTRRSSTAGSRTAAAARLRADGPWSKPRAPDASDSARRARTPVPHDRRGAERRQPRKRNRGGPSSANQMRLAWTREASTTRLATANSTPTSGAGGALAAQ